MHSFGYLVVFMQQPSAVMGLMTTGLALILLWGLFFPNAGAGSPSARRTPRVA